MPGVIAQHSQPIRTSQKSASSGSYRGARSLAPILGGWSFKRWLDNGGKDYTGALPLNAVFDANTGRSRVGVEAWVDRKLERERLDADTERFADILEQHGVRARTGASLVAIGQVTGEIERLEGWRNTNILPLVASKNRAALLRELRYFMEQHPRGHWMRYGVVTMGQRMELFSDLRRHMRDKHRRLSRWAQWAGENYGVHVVFRYGELTVNENLTFHPHMNILYFLDKKLSAEDWAAFKWRSSEIFGARWEDNGLCKSAAEIVKYFAKGDDLNLLAEMACSVPEWADGEFNLLGAADAVARRFASAAKDGRPAEAFFGKAISHVQKLSFCLRQLARSGSPHPFVWLFHQLFDLNIAQPMGDFRSMRRGLRLHHQRVMSVATGDGEYVLCRVARDRREGAEQPVDLLTRENEVLSRTSPQPRFSPYGEPVLLVRNYTEKPRTMIGMLALRRMQDESNRARKTWLLNGAPAPDDVIQSVRAATLAARPQLCEDAAVGVAAPYSSHYNDNCGDDLPYSTPCGDLIDRSTGEVLFECPPPDVGDRFEWWNPDNWGLEIKAKHSVLVDKMSAARFLWTKESREKLLRTYDLLSAIEAVLK